MKDQQLDGLVRQAIQKNGKEVVETLLKLLLLDYSHTDRLFQAACKLQAKYHGISPRELLTSKKADILLTRHLMIYTLYEDQGWVVPKIKRHFRIQRNSWIVSIIALTAGRLKMNYLNVPQEYERISTSIEALSQTFLNPQTQL